jgi:hypothetical protein
LATGFFRLIFGPKAKFLPDEIPIRSIKSFDAEFDKLWASASRELVIAGIRDSRRLNWRFRYVPHRKYTALAAEERGKPIAYVVLRTAEIGTVRIGLLVDLLADPQAEEALLWLLRVSEAHFRSKQASMILSILLPGRYADILKKAGYARLPRLLEPKEWIFIVHFNDSSLDRDLVKNKINWHLTFEDTDVF